MIGWRLLVVALAMVGCRNAPASDNQADSSPPSLPDLSAGLAAPEAAVKRFFTAAEGEDCPTLAELLILPDAGTLTAEGCEAITHDFTESKAHLLRIIESKVDGRDKRVVLVSTEVEYQKKKSGNLHQWVIRAEWRGGVWKVRF